jgi:hypothetical protein
LEQTSTTISLRVERVVKAFPQDVQRTAVSVSPGWTCFKEIPPSCLRWPRPADRSPPAAPPHKVKRLPARAHSLSRPRKGRADRKGRTIEAEAEDPVAWSGEESVDQEPDRHPSGDRERSQDDKQGSQLATRLSLDLARGLLFTRPGKSTAGSGFRFDKSLSEDQERLHMSIVNVEQDAGAHLLGGYPDGGLQEKL